jgi:hypothetical protein
VTADLEAAIPASAVFAPTRAFTEGHLFAAAKNLVHALEAEQDFYARVLAAQGS